MMTAPDMVIEMLVTSEAELIDRIVLLTAERDAERLLARAAVHALHERAVELDRLQRQHHRLLGEYRALRVREAA